MVRIFPTLPGCLAWVVPNFKPNSRKPKCQHLVNNKLQEDSDFRAGLNCGLNDFLHDSLGGCSFKIV